MLLGKLGECTQQENEFWKKFQKTRKTREKRNPPGTRGYAYKITFQIFIMTTSTSNIKSEEPNEEIKQSVDFEISKDEIKIQLRKLKYKKATGEVECFSPQTKFY